MSVDWNGLAILIVNKQGRFYALENRCPHADQMLDGGELEGDEIICPWHGTGFCIKPVMLRVHRLTKILRHFRLDK